MTITDGKQRIGGGASPVLEGRILALIEPSLDAMGYAIVRVQLGGGQRPVLQIMAERRDDVAMSVDDCATISRAVSALLDVEDPIRDAYTLEVSSPGIDRPLTRRPDFNRFAGFEARIETGLAVDGRRRFKGLLLGMDADGLVKIREDATEFAVPFNAIQRAKLVLTDDLIANSPDRPRLPDADGADIATGET